MSKVGGSDSEGMELIPASKQKCIVTNVFEHHSSWQGGPAVNKVLVEFELQELTFDDGTKRSYWAFVTQGYNQKSAKHHGTKFFKQLFGRDLAPSEVNELRDEFDYEWLIGVKAVVTFGIGLKADGVTEVNDIRAIELKSPKAASVEAFKANWEDAGSPTGEKRERYPESCLPGFVGEPVGAAVGASSTEKDEGF